MLSKEKVLVNHFEVHLNPHFMLLHRRDLKFLAPSHVGAALYADFLHTFPCCW